MDFAVIGGDMRQAALARLLAADGHNVRCAGLEGGGVECLPPEKALEGAEYVVLPLPAGGGVYINAPLSGRRIGAEELTGHIRPKQTLLAGKVEGRLAELIDERGIRFADYFTREELTVRNAAITAEGAVELLMREMPVTLLGSRVLVVGFGRIGKLLALRLHLLGARVTVSARKSADMAWIECLGLESADTRRLRGRLGGFDAVVNTVPAPVLDARALLEFKRDCLCLELASKPGGVDADAAGELGIRIIAAPGLPGKAAPESAAAAIKEAIYNIINELESE